MLFRIFIKINNYKYNIYFANILIINKIEENFLQIFTKFLKIVNQYTLLVIFINNNYIIANVYTKIL